MCYFCAQYGLFFDAHPVTVFPWRHMLGFIFLFQDCQKYLSTSNVFLDASGRPSLSLPKLPWIVHSRSTIKASPSIIFSGLRILRQISIEFVVRLRAISLEKPSRCSTREPKLVSNVNQLLSTVISLSLNSIVIAVPMPFLMWLSLHC